MTDTAPAYTAADTLTCNDCPQPSTWYCTCCENPHCNAHLRIGPYTWMVLCPSCDDHGHGPCPTDTGATP